MRKVLAALTLLALVVTPVLAKDMARETDVYVEAVPQDYQDTMNRGNCQVVCILEGTFTDLSAAYVAGLEANGLEPDVIYDPYGAFDPTGMEVVIYNTSDNWWDTYGAFAADEAILAAYVDAGGAIAVIGQDYLYARGGQAGFPVDYLGMISAVEDVNWADEYLTWEGTADGPFDGLSEFDMFACYGSNPYFTDEVTPASQGVVTWSSATWGPAEGGSCDAGIFSTVDFGCSAYCTDAVTAMLAYFGGLTPTEDASWGSIKGMFR